MDRSSRILVLGHGMPINFHYTESDCHRYVDLVLAGLAVGAAAPADERLRPGHNVAATHAILAGSNTVDDGYRLYGPAAGGSCG